MTNFDDPLEQRIAINAKELTFNRKVAHAHKQILSIMSEVGYSPDAVEQAVWEFGMAFIAIFDNPAATTKLREELYKHPAHVEFLRILAAMHRAGMEK